MAKRKDDRLKRAELAVERVARATRSGRVDTILRVTRGDTVLVEAIVKPEGLYYLPDNLCVTHGPAIGRGGVLVSRLDQEADGIVLERLLTCLGLKKLIRGVRSALAAC